MSCETIYGNIQGCATPIVLPTTQGPSGSAGAAGTDGVALLYNNHTAVGDADNANPQSLMSKALDADELASTGDMIKIEAYFTIDGTVTGQFNIKMGSTNLVTYTLNNVSYGFVPPSNQIKLKLEAIVTRTGASSQALEKKASLLSMPQQDLPYALTTSSEDLTSSLTVSAVSTKDSSGGANEVYCNYLRITKYKI